MCRSAGAIGKSACPSAAACVAAGSYQDATGVMQGLVERQR